MATATALASLVGCSPPALDERDFSGSEAHAPSQSADPDAAPPTVKDGRFDDASTAAARAHMVRDQIEARGVSDPRVLAALRAVPRHEFVPAKARADAYEDRPLRIEAGQTISQPYIVALLAELAEIEPGEKVLEVGTGSGYQAAVLAAMGAEVYSIEIVEALARTARERLERLGYDDRVTVRHGDGYAGWPELAPFQAIVITAAPPEIPEPLEQQLAIGGRMVVPVGRYQQDLVLLERTAKGLEKREIIPVRFVPMTGRAQEGQ